MTIRTIPVPPPIEVTLRGNNPQTNEREEKTLTYSFRDFLDAILNMPEWAKDWRAIKNAMEIDAAFDEAGFDLGDAPYDMLKKCIEEPSQGYALHNQLLRQVGPFFLAVIDAPEKKKAKVEAA